MNNNIISPNLQLPPTLLKPEALPSLEVMSLPPNIKVGDMIFLEVLMNNNSFSFNILGDTEKIPLQLKDTPDFRTELPSQIAAKVVGEKTLQIINPEKRAPQPVTTEAQTVIIKETNTTLPQTKLLPLNGRQITTQIMHELKLPDTVQKDINTLLPEANLNLKINAPIAENNQINNILQPLKDAVQNLSSAISRNNPPQIALARKQVVTALQSLENQKFIATPKMESAQVVRQLESPLGKLILETPLKLTAETKLELSVQEVKTETPPVISKQLPIEILQKIFESPEVKILFPLGDSERLLTLLNNRDGAISNLLKVFEPLQSQLQLAQPVLQKLPTLGTTLLSNMVSFYRGAVEQDSQVWLGQETITQLTNSGIEGRAVLQNLQDFVTSSLRETPSWRVVEMPFFDGSQLIPIKLALKKDKEDNEEQAPRQDKNGVRFVIETEFSKLGAFQLDGFSVAKERRLDLIIRTSKRQSEDFCSHIINLFKTSLYNVDYIGSISVNQKQTFVRTDTDSVANLPQGVFI